MRLDSREAIRVTTRRWRLPDRDPEVATSPFGWSARTPGDQPMREQIVSVIIAATT